MLWSILAPSFNLKTKNLTVLMIATITFIRFSLVSSFHIHYAAAKQRRNFVVTNRIRNVLCSQSDGPLKRRSPTHIFADSDIYTDCDSGDCETYTEAVDGAIEHQKKLKLKVRQHVNPLASTYLIPLDLPATWLDSNNGYFENPSLPIYLDIGCAKGTWCLQMAQAHPDCNFLGLEIRRPVVALAMHRKNSLRLKNLYYLAANANVDLKRILSDLQTKNLELRQISIQFPDPHFKKAHWKRRTVTDELCV